MAESRFLQQLATTSPQNQSSLSRVQYRSSPSVTMSLSYRGHGPDVLYQAFNISCFAGNALLGLAGCPTAKDCARYRYCPDPTDARWTALRLTKESILPKSPKTHLTSLPFEIRAMILRHILGDRKVHAHHEQQVTCDPDDPMSEVSTANVVIVLFSCI